MHRSGTSALARGLAALSVYLGDNFFDLAPDNPTGYWEDKSLVEISQRVLEELQLKWDDTQLIAPERFQHYRIRLLQFKAAHYFNEVFMPRPLWGFKDPRAIRLLPFWLGAIAKCHAADSYVMAIRHPTSVAASLFRRQQIPNAKALQLWLVHNVPFLRELRDKSLVVVDYDLLTEKPREQLERIAHRLDFACGSAASSREMERFTDDFLDEGLRHNVASAEDFDTTSDLGRLTQDAYRLLHDLATDEREAGPAFWSAWETIAQRFEALPQTGD